MARETLSGLQRRLLLLTITQLFDRLRDQFLKLFDLALLAEENPEISGFIGTPQQFRAIVDEFLVIAEISGITIETAVHRKYPRKCPYCGARQCECGEHKRNPHKRLRQPFPEGGLTLSEAVDMLAEIYPPRPFHEQILKVVEEIEEAKQEMGPSSGNRDRQDEFADVFARMAALATHLDIDLEGTAT